LCASWRLGWFRISAFGFLSDFGASDFGFRLGWLWVAPMLLLAAGRAPAQVPPHVPAGGQLQLQVAQPAVDVSSPVTATAAFEPAVLLPGGKTFYRVSINATESSVEWPDDLPAPAGLKFGAKARGMITQTQINSYRPLATFLYEVEATAAGRYTIPSFTVKVSGEPVEIPGATMEVLPAGSQLPAGAAPPRRLVLETSATNLYLGQPFRVRVLLPPAPGNQIAALREIQLNGDGLMMDKTALRQSIEPANVNGELRPAFVCELLVTPIAAGPLKFSAQAFTAGSEFTAPISIRGQVNLPGGPPKYELMISDPVALQVRPLPADQELPGFTGAIGRFFCDPPQLSSDQLRVGQPAQLKLTFHGEGDLSRFAPPVAPRARDWQVIADPPPATSFTLIPLTDETRATPAIPFCYFDPQIGKYQNLSVPAIPVTVTGDGLPTELPTWDESGKAGAPLKLSGLATAPGKVIGSLKPLQQRFWFLGLQAVPPAGFLALMIWDRRRRFLAAHPEIVRRARARRALRRIKRQMEEAAAAGDAAAYVQQAARAMSIAVAPHFPADPQALVGADVLAQLDPAARSGQAGETVRIVFAAADAQYAGSPQPHPELAAIRAGVEAVLQKLEEQL
jgi:hypothetical protein